jgi:TolB protein
MGAVALLTLWSFSGSSGQEVEERFPGVRLGLLYEGAFQPVLAIKPFSSRFGGEAAANQVEAIIARDLRYSDRFEIVDSLPASLVGEGVDYALWDQIGADWLVVGQVEGMGEEYRLILELHDVVYGELKGEARIPVPDPSSEEFRMAVHLASDALVFWITGEPGMAASRIAFSQRGADGAQELYLVDSDGETLRRITRHRGLLLSPSWSPDAARIAYSAMRGDSWRIYELNLETGAERVLPAVRSGDHYTPAYHPNGREIAFNVSGGGRSGLFTYNWMEECCLAQLAGGRSDDLSPTYSPDGRWLAFNSNRLGVATPQIYVMPSGGGEAELISPYVYGSGGHYNAPDWAPFGNRVAFHGRIRRGRYQILVAEIEDRGKRVVQLTSEGNNEDPSWAPDGRHLVFVGERSYGYGLFVVDAGSGRIRTLLSNVIARVPEWSPALGSPDAATLRGAQF